MWRIVQLLGKFGNFFLFLFLELIALLIIVTFNKPQREISQSLLLETSASLSSFQSSIGGYFNLGSENEKLQELNAELLAELQNARDSIKTYQFRRPTSLDFIHLPDSLKNDSTFDRTKAIPLDLPDSLFPVQGFRFLPCLTINNSTHNNYNYITIDRGSRHGVRSGMGLIAPNGVAGQITQVSRNYALAQSVLNKKFNLSSKLLTNKNIGTITWDGADPEFAILKFIPQTSIISRGDTVVTSGYSFTFPPNYFIGTVADYDAETEDGFFNIKVKLAVDFQSIDNMFVVMHDRKPEIDSLQTKGEGR